ncbi:MAG: radical SAM protein [Thermofilum sp.]|nr:radical SAM protein [Thermofilum sp.]
MPPSASEDPQLLVGGWREVSLVDVLESVSFTLWLAYCNLRCPWCSNARLARGLEARAVRVSEVVDAVKAARPFIDVFHVTGGEPALQLRPLLVLYERVRGETGLPLSLDTNGTMPEALEELAPLLHHVAIDVKAPLSDPALYARATGTSEQLARKLVARVQRSVEVACKVPFLELRTTLVPDLVSCGDAFRAAAELEWAVGRGRRVVYVVQQFIPYEGVLGEYSRRKATPAEEVKACAEKIASKLGYREVYYRTLEEGAKKVEHSYRRSR